MRFSLFGRHIRPTICRIDEIKHAGRAQCSARWKHFWCFAARPQPSNIVLAIQWLNTHISSINGSPSHCADARSISYLSFVQRPCAVRPKPTPQNRTLPSNTLSTNSFFYLLLGMHARARDLSTSLHLSCSPVSLWKMWFFSLHLAISVALWKSRKTNRNIIYGKHRTLALASKTTL